MTFPEARLRREFDKAIPFINELLATFPPATLLIRVEGFRVSSYKILFRALMRYGIDSLLAAGKHEKSATLGQFWRTWSIREDKAMEIKGYCVLSTSRFHSGPTYTTLFNAETGYTPLKLSAGVPHEVIGDAPRIHEPTLSEAYDQPYDEEAFRAFAYLKANGRLSPAVVLRGITLSQLPDVSVTHPSLLIIDHEENAIVIL